jgi:Domain of unknown function (DUF6249)
MDFGSSPLVVGCIAVVAVVGMNFVNAQSRRRLLHEERIKAIEKGVPLPEDLLTEVETNNKPRAAGRNAAMQGTVWTALGLGMMASSRFAQHSEFGSDMRQFLSFLEVWAYPATFVGIGLLLFAFFTREKRKS